MVQATAPSCDLFKGLACVFFFAFALFLLRLSNVAEGVPHTNPDFLHSAILDSSRSIFRSSAPAALPKPETREGARDVDWELLLLFFLNIPSGKLAA